MKTFNVNTDQLIVKFTCPVCEDAVEADVSESIPMPDWGAEHVTDSENIDSVDVICDSCGAEFTIEIFKNIYEGNLRITYLDGEGHEQEIDDVDIELEEYESPDYSDGDV